MFVLNKGGHYVDSVQIFQIVVTAILWVATIVLLIGRGAIFGIGAHYTLNDEEKETYKKRVDSEAQYKFIGKTLMLPLSVLFTVFTIAELTESALWDWLRSSPWIGIIAFIIIFGYVIFIIRLSSSKFKK